MSAPMRRPAEACLSRMAPLARLPVFLTLAGRRAIVVGDAAPVAWKAELLSAAGAEVDVFAEHPCEELRALAHFPPKSIHRRAVIAGLDPAIHLLREKLMDPRVKPAGDAWGPDSSVAAPRGAIALRRRAWRAGDLPGAAVAVAGFDGEAEAQRFARAARAAGVPVNVIDRPAYCDFAFGAIVNRSPLVIGISTGGAAPVFAQAIRGRLEAMIPRGFARWAEAARRWRPTLRRAGLSLAARLRFWQAFARLALAHPERAPAPSDLAALLDASLTDGAAGLGTVTLIDAGAGDPELLTLRALRALQSADVVLIDDGVASDVVDFARREARKLWIGTATHDPSREQEDSRARAIALAAAGQRVAWLRGSDPMTGRDADAMIAACRAAGIAVEVAPGVSPETRERHRPTKGASAFESILHVR